MINRRGEFSFEQIIALILVLIVVILAASFLFRAQILNYIQSIPGYQMPQADAGVNTDVSGDSIAQNNSCIEVGKVVEGVIYIGKSPNYVKTDLLWKGNDLEGKIIYDGPRKWHGYILPWMNGNIDVGYIEAGKAYAHNFKEGELDNKIMSQLNQIHNTRKINFNNQLCKNDNQS